MSDTYDLDWAKQVIAGTTTPAAMFKKRVADLFHASQHGLRLSEAIALVKELGGWEPVADFGPDWCTPGTEDHMRWAVAMEAEQKRHTAALEALAKGLRPGGVAAEASRGGAQ